MADTLKFQTTQQELGGLTVADVAAIVGGSSGVTIGSSTVSGGINGRGLINNAGVLGQTAGTPATLDVADQTVSGGANVTSKSLTTGNITVDCGACPLQFITNNGAFTITAPVADGSCMLLATNSASAGAITFTGFSVGSNTGDALTTTSGNKFTLSIWRINSVSGYRIAAHQ